MKFSPSAPYFEDLEWRVDQSAFGSRHKAHFESRNGARVELVAWTDGTWLVNYLDSVANGDDKDLDAAKKRAFHVWIAMTEAL